MGVDFMTIHTGITREAAAYAEKKQNIRRCFPVAAQ